MTAVQTDRCVNMIVQTDRCINMIVQYRQTGV